MCWRRAGSAGEAGVFASSSRPTSAVVAAAGELFFGDLLPSNRRGAAATQAEGDGPREAVVFGCVERPLWELRRPAQGGGGGPKRDLPEGKQR